MADAQREGFKIPGYCPRGRTDCIAVAQVISTGHASFICCGENDGTALRIKQDRMTFCQKSEGGVDMLVFLDSRDLAHMAGVLAMASAIKAPVVAPVQDGTMEQPHG